MDPINRGRSPSVNASTNIRHTPSPSPHQGFRNQPSVTGLGLEQAVAFTDNSSFNGQLANSQQATFDGAIDFSSVSQSFPEQNTFAQNSLFQDQGLAQANASAAQFNQDSVLFSEFSNLNDTTTINGTFDGPLFQSAEDNTDLIGPTALDPRLLDQQQAQQSPDPNSLMAQMTTQAQSPTPPHLLSPAMHRQSSQSPHGSPALNQGGFQSHSPAHSRNTSLDPSSAAYPQMQAWAGGDAFRGHRRAPSDAHSDVSSSAHPSPYLGNVDSFEQPISNHSPLLGAQQDPAMYQDITQPIEQFSISQGPNQYISPAHSPVPSPRLAPQQHPLPVFTSADNFGLQQGVIEAPMPMSFNGMQGIGFLPSQNQDQFPDFGRQDMGGQADTMSPPEISIQLAPPSRQSSFEPPKPDQGPEDSLSPPERSRSRNRMRAKSDPFSGGSSRASTPGAREKDMLSPAAAGVGSRSPSPSAKGRRSSTSSVPNRDYILDLADPSRPSSNNSDGGSASKRIQKHPATFQCSLCPKRFTRAYNLRSHLRTHTDERPFVCSVCGKAFARQHDRKRHEGLHSGEKKFVCRGQLKDGNPWGCGRRFARADALGRHFRSEAGRVCIKPLLEEEALERMQQGQDQNAAAMQQMPPMGPGMVPGAPMMQPQPGFDPYGAPQAGYDPNMVPQMPYRLPAALLQQYPTLGGIWDTLPANAQEDVEGNISGRSSFDAGSSAGEYDDGEGEYTGGPAAYGWASDVGP